MERRILFIFNFRFFNDILIISIAGHNGELRLAGISHSLILFAATAVSGITPGIYSIAAAPPFATPAIHTHSGFATPFHNILLIAGPVIIICCFYYYCQYFWLNLLFGIFDYSALPGVCQFRPFQLQDYCQPGQAGLLLQPACRASGPGRAIGFPHLFQ